MVYLGYPNVIRLEQEASFAPKTFARLARLHGIEPQFTDVESHNSIHPEELYHSPLRRLFKIIRRNHPEIHPYIALRYALNGNNDTVGPDELVPSLLVFGALPSYPISNKDFFGQTAFMKAIVDARSKYGNI